MKKCFDLFAFCFPPQMNVAVYSNKETEEVGGSELQETSSVRTATAVKERLFFPLQEHIVIRKTTLVTLYFFKQTVSDVPSMFV